MDLVNFWSTFVRARFTKSEKGAALVEYALLLALIAIVCIIALQFLGGSAADKFSEVGNSIAAT